MGLLGLPPRRAAPSGRPERLAGPQKLLETTCNDLSIFAFGRVCVQKAALRARAEPSAADTNQNLLEAAIAGDAEAFGALYDVYLSRVYRHVFYWVGNHAEAEDLTQQVFLQAWQAMPRYRLTQAPFSAWLLTIAHNLLVSDHRRRKGLEACPFDAEVKSVARWTDPEVETFARYESQTVREAVLRLKPEQRQVVLLRFVEDFSHADIAAAMGKSEGNVRVILHRALGELRRLLTREVKL